MKLARVVTASVIAFGLIFAPLAVFAATPPSGTLSPSTPTLTYTYGPNAVSNPSAQAQSGGVCNPPAQPCDHYDLTVDLPTDYDLTHPTDQIRIETVQMV